MTTNVDKCVHGKPLRDPCGECMVVATSEAKRLLCEPVMVELAFDPVKKPVHYNQGEVECIDAMIAAFGLEAVQSYCRIAAFKYLWRHNHKGTPEQDIDKAVWYLRFSMNDDPRKPNL